MTFIATTPALRNAFNAAHLMFGLRFLKLPGMQPSYAQPLLMLILRPLLFRKQNVLTI